MEEIVVKTEMQPSEEILLFYVDENGDNEQSVLTTVENIEQVHDEHQGDSYLVEQEIHQINDNDTQLGEQIGVKERWQDEETKRLLIFYIDNKDTFVNGPTKKKHLWAIACKTILSSKNPTTCEMKLRNMKKKYSQYVIEKKKGNIVNWLHFEMCHKAFHDDSYVRSLLKDAEKQEILNVTSSVKATPNHGGISVIKKIYSKSYAPGDEKVTMMLNLYLKYKKNFKKEYWQKSLWDTIAGEIGQEDGEFWHKRFLNFKQHYVSMLYKREQSGADSVTWPYMQLFDKIFEGDEGFHRKYASLKGNKDQINTQNLVITSVTTPPLEHSWNDTEMMVLVKYYFDCFHEFQDPTIPNNFLWTEVGRLLDKSHESCKLKYEELKTVHLNKYIEGSYNLRERLPQAIVLDNIISKEIRLEMSKAWKQSGHEMWAADKIDDLVQFFYDSIEMFKDPTCYFVCWAAIAKKLNQNVLSCKNQWDDLIVLYKSILDDKKENPDMQIDWRYIELFERIFDYGMDIHLLDGYEKSLNQSNKHSIDDSEMIGVKKVKINSADETYVYENMSDEEEYDERGFIKRKKRKTIGLRILEFYLKHKDEFSATENKLGLWETLAKQVGISAKDCAHRFRSIRQTYTNYVERETNKPDLPILWPHYELCKKVYGYKKLKSKVEHPEDWTPRKIKQLINYFSRNYHAINKCPEDITKWEALASEIGKTETACRDKFLEFRKSYRKLKTMKSRNPDVKISWKYFSLLDEIYNTKGVGNLEAIQESMNFDELDDGVHEENMSFDENMSVDDNLPADLNVKTESQEDDDFQCIIVIPEGQDLDNAQLLLPDNAESTTTVDKPTKVNSRLTTWTNRLKRKLLVAYLSYIRSHKDKEIDSTAMWQEIATKIPNKTDFKCKNMFIKLKKIHMKTDTDDINKKRYPFFNLFEKILRFKPKFKNSVHRIHSENKTYKDVSLPAPKVMQALEYYSQYLEEFISPKFDKNYLWTELANYVSEPLNKVFNKVHYLKQTYNTGGTIDDVTVTELLKSIVEKENELKKCRDKESISLPIIDDEVEEIWSNEEIEQLLIWYLANLEKFKNPKFLRKYLWIEASDILKKSPLICSKKMIELRTQYRTMVRENPEDLNTWRFHELCQKIYGTGKKNDSNN